MPSSKRRRSDEFRSTSAVDLFATARNGTPSRTNPYSLPQVRVSEALAQRLSAYGNAHGLNYSETVRAVLDLGLQKAEEDDDGDSED